MLQQNTHLIISTATDLLRINIRHILYIQSDGNYCTLFLIGGMMRLVTCQLGQVEKMIAAQLSDNANNFVRIGRSLIINRNYVYYISVAKQQLTLCDNHLETYSLNPSREALVALKTLIEKEMKN